MYIFKILIFIIYYLYKFIKIIFFIPIIYILKFLFNKCYEWFFSIHMFRWFFFSYWYLKAMDNYVFMGFHPVMSTHPILGKLIQKHIASLPYSLRNDIRLHEMSLYKSGKRDKRYYLFNFLKKYIEPLNKNFFTKIIKVWHWYYTKKINFYVNREYLILEIKKKTDIRETIINPLKNDIWNLSLEIAYLLKKLYIRFVWLFYFILDLLFFRFMKFGKFLSFSKDISLFSLSKNYLWFIIYKCFFLEYWSNSEFFILNKKFFAVFFRFHIIEFIWVCIYLFFSLIFNICAYIFMPIFFILSFLVTFFWFCFLMKRSFPLIRIICRIIACRDNFPFFIKYLWKDFVEDHIYNFCIYYFKFFFFDSLYNTKITIKKIVYFFIIYFGFLKSFLLFILILFPLWLLFLFICFLLQAVLFWITCSLKTWKSARNKTNLVHLVNNLCYLDFILIHRLDFFLSRSYIYTILKMWDIHFLKPCLDFVTKPFFFNFKKNFEKWMRKLCLIYYKNPLVLKLFKKLFFSKYYNFNFIPYMTDLDKLKWKYTLNDLYYDFLVAYLGDAYTKREMLVELAKVKVFNQLEREQWLRKRNFRKYNIHNNLTLWEKIKIFYKYITSVVIGDFTVFWRLTFVMPFVYYYHCWMLFGFVIKSVLKQRRDWFIRRKLRIKNYKAIIEWLKITWIYWWIYSWLNFIVGFIRYFFWRLKLRRKYFFKTLRKKRYYYWYYYKGKIKTFLEDSFSEKSKKLFNLFFSILVLPFYIFSTIIYYFIEKIADFISFKNDLISVFFNKKFYNDFYSNKFIKWFYDSFICIFDDTF